MDRQPVNSSNVVSVGYDPGAEILEVEFKSGIYRYFGVPAFLYERLKDAESIGKFLNDNIKPNYRAERV